MPFVSGSAPPKESIRDIHMSLDSFHRESMKHFASSLLTIGNAAKEG